MQMKPATEADVKPWLEKLLPHNPTMVRQQAAQQHWFCLTVHTGRSNQEGHVHIKQGCCCCCKAAGAMLV
jgi:hypothetical protein